MLHLSLPPCEASRLSSANSLAGSFKGHCVKEGGGGSRTPFRQMSLVIKACLREERVMSSFKHISFPSRIFLRKPLDFWQLGKVWDGILSSLSVFHCIACRMKWVPTVISFWGLPFPAAWNTSPFICSMMVSKGNSENWNLGRDTFCLSSFIVTRHSTGVFRHSTSRNVQWRKRLLLLNFRLLRKCSRQEKAPLPS